MSIGVIRRLVHFTANLRGNSHVLKTRFKLQQIVAGVPPRRGEALIALLQLGCPTFLRFGDFSQVSQGRSSSSSSGFAVQIFELWVGKEPDLTKLNSKLESSIFRPPIWRARTD